MWKQLKNNLEFDRKITVISKLISSDVYNFSYVKLVKRADIFFFSGEGGFYPRNVILVLLVRE